MQKKHNTDMNQKNMEMLCCCCRNMAEEKKKR